MANHYEESNVKIKHVGMKNLQESASFNLRYSNICEFRNRGNYRVRDQKTCFFGCV